MVIPRPLEGVPSLLRAELEEAWKRFRRLRLFELRVMQATYRKEIWASLDGDGQSLQQKKCRLAVLETVEVWRRKKEREAPTWQKSPLVHLQVLRRHLRKHGLIEEDLIEETLNEEGLVKEDLNEKERTDPKPVPA